MEVAWTWPATEQTKQAMEQHIKVISAGAGSGKTYRLTTEMVRLMTEGGVRPAGIIATTFTRKAAAELQERVRVRLLQQQLPELANELGNALIGTVHALGVRLLQRFAFEAGVSPQVAIMADENQQQLFNQSLSMVLTDERIAVMEALSERLGLQKETYHATDWRSLLKTLTEAARSNGIEPAALAGCRDKSVGAFLELLDTVDTGRTAAEWAGQLRRHLDEAIQALAGNQSDSTKVTADVRKELARIRTMLDQQDLLPWYEWARLGKLQPGAKSRELTEPLKAFANTHLGHGQFHADIRDFQHHLFDIAGLAMSEYDRYKRARGLIDYTDMEELVNRLLDQPAVRAVLAEETDLLMVDEFQDTSPLQLSIFLKLSRLARHAVWVGDPKQSIYGFRGAEPALMEAIIRRQGGLAPENILSDSWRSREDIVWATNALFTKAFPQMTREQVILQPKRRKVAVAGDPTVSVDPPGMGAALMYWQFEVEGEGRKPGKDWFMRALAEVLSERLAEDWKVVPKGRGNPRQAVPGDVAILCRTNKECQEMAGALHRAGLRAAISRTGLTGTAEARLVIACLRFLLNRYDPLSTAEIMVLAEGLALESVVEDRLDFLDRQRAAGNLPEYRWGEERPFIQRLKGLRATVAALSTAETLAILLEEMELRRVMAAWGNAAQRMANVDMLCQSAQRYEDACHRLQRAASLGGFLIWLQELERAGTDLQGSGEHRQAVNVLTYHKSKGLEYPVTICFGLEGKLSDEVWGVSVMPADSEGIDLENVLAGRWLRCWVNPYSNQFSNSVLAERLAQSDARQRRREEALAEEARLLYVGITRARDYLVIPVRWEAPGWLDRVYGGEKDAGPFFAAEPAARPADGLQDRIPTRQGGPEWEGVRIPVATSRHAFGRDLPNREPVPAELYFLGERVGRRDHLPAVLEWDGQPGPAWNPVDTYRYASPLESDTAAHVAAAIRGMLVSADVPSAEASPRREDEIPEQPVPADPEAAREVLLRVRMFRALEALPYMTAGMRYPLYPVSVRQGLQEYEGCVDEFLDTGEALHLVVHLVGTVGEERHRQQQWRQQWSWLPVAAAQLRAAKGRLSATVWMHYITEGKVFRFE